MRGWEFILHPHLSRKVHHASRPFNGARPALLPVDLDTRIWQLGLGGGRVTREDPDLCKNMGEGLGAGGNGMHDPEGFLPFSQQWCGAHTGNTLWPWAASFAVKRLPTSPVAPAATEA